MTGQNRPINPPPNIINLLSGHVDLLSNLMEVMAGMRRYASLSVLSTINKEFNALVQPHLRKIKKRIVVELSDLKKVPTGRYKDIE
jgi:hypothetical protein